jgi:hypothetical protein
MARQELPLKNTLCLVILWTSFEATETQKQRIVFNFNYIWQRSLSLRILTLVEETWNGARGITSLERWYGSNMAAYQNSKQISTIFEFEVFLLTEHTAAVPTKQS